MSSIYRLSDRFGFVSGDKIICIVVHLSIFVFSIYIFAAIKLKFWLRPFFFDRQQDLIKNSTKGTNSGFVLALTF